ncbi:tagaturonate reductase [Bifidobacterium avesanii]|uniref:Tagaturonate reductase n=1 Tax=Bifidobacterium avesanii TaxID=1798157 RepID=A0A7K3THD4_9BIFI|nr:tagaturonate reductase [Bifidobacterium avesanii]KAB8292665.1 mannitol dehydrogenase [Bifidobacterium avesanii]NEG78507.1 tagaturonate reductase [Bifidobacterium avesanii]
MEKLNVNVAIERGLTTADAANRPIKLIQFGEGNFLRAFVDWIVQQLNNNGLFNGNVAIVQPLPFGRVAELEKQNNLYTVILEGLKNGREVQSREVIDSVGKTVDPYQDFDAYLALADDPNTQIIISNTTEAGIALSDEDSADAKPAKSYPGKLAQLLKRRFDKGLPGFLIVPCELIADNGVALKKCLEETAEKFGYGEDFVKWLDEENTFVSTLVDRIVPGFPRDNAEALWDELGYRDDNMVKAEPFLLWAVAGSKEAQAKVDELIPAKRLGIDLVTADAVQPYRERKVYLLNGPHTTMAQVARLAGFTTVGEVMNDPTMRSFIEKEMHEDIIPVLTLPEDELNAFADAVCERYSNPFVKHALDSIGLNSVSKFTARLLPLVTANVEAGRGLPKRIVLALSALLATYGGLAEQPVNINDSDDVVARIQDAAADRATFVTNALGDASLWGSDLNGIEGLTEAVEANVAAIEQDGIQPLIDALA